MIQLSIGVQTDQGETEVDGSSAQNTAGQELGAPEGVSQTALESAGASHTPSTPSSAASPSAALAIISDSEAAQLQPSAGNGVQPGLASEPELWTLICTLAFLLVLQVIAVLTTRTLSEPLHELPIHVQNDVAATAPSRTQTPDLGEAVPGTGSSGRQERRPTDPDRSSFALVPFTPTHIQHPMEEGPDSNTIAQPPPQDPPIESDTSQVEAQTPNPGAEPVSGVGLDSAEAEVQESTQPISTSINPSTPAGLRRSRPQTTPPSAESQRRPPKRIREETSGELAEVEGVIPPHVPLSSPVLGNANAEADGSGQSQMTQEKLISLPILRTKQGIDQGGPLPIALASIAQTTPDVAPEQIPSSDSDHDTSMESVSAPDPDSKAKGKNVPRGNVSAVPTLDPTSHLQRRPDPSSGQGMDVDPESLDFKTPGPSLAGVPSSSTGVQSNAAGAKGLKPTGRPIKRVHLVLRPPQPKPTPSQNDVPMAVDEVGRSVLIRGSSSPGHPSSPPHATGSKISHDNQENYAKAGDSCPSPMKLDQPETQVADSEASHHDDTVETDDESLSERDTSIPNDGEANIMPTEQSADEVDELDSDDNPLYLSRGSSPAGHGQNEENNGDHHSVTADHEAESSDDGSDFSDAVHEAKASKYNLSNANAAAEIEKELGETSDPEIQPQAPVPTPTP
ncbi:hypothetical protein FS837_006174 [Tulasnella sp. UAMH 9824]|nr:hypothetical protein FS837_006174 [Tulasnella sp. UAMH 9824]